MANPYILFENVFEDGTITSDSEASGYPDDNAIDWRASVPYRWKANDTTSPTWITVDLGVGNSANPDTVAIGGHNLNSAGARYKVQYSNDNFSGDTNDAFSVVTPDSDSPLMTTFTASAQRYWRLYIDHVGTFAEAPQVGIVTLGRRLEIPALAPSIDAYGYEPMTDTAQNENGAPLGANLRYRARTFDLSYDAPGFLVTDFFDPVSGLTWDGDFLPHAEVDPFWFAWNLAVQAGDDDGGVYLCRMTGGIGMPHIGSTLRRGINCTFQASDPV